MKKIFNDKIKVHTTSLGTQYVDIAEVRMLDMGSTLKELIQERLAKINREEEEVKDEIVAGLRWISKTATSHQEYEMVVCRDAADRIEQLEAENESLILLLERFNSAGERIIRIVGGDPNRPDYVNTLHDLTMSVIDARKTLHSSPNCRILTEKVNDNYCRKCRERLFND